MTVTACDMPVVSFPDDNLNKYQWILAKFDMCIDTVEIWIGAIGQISSIFDGVICPRPARIFVSGQ